MIETLALREREVLQAMVACSYGFELKEKLGTRIGWQTLENLCNRGLAVGGACPAWPESNGWAITELGRCVLAAHQAREKEKSALREVLLTAEQCRTGRDLLQWTPLDLARRAQCTVGAIQSFEAQGHTSLPRIRNALRLALERAGVEFDPTVTSGVQLKTLVR